MGTWFTEALRRPRGFSADGRTSTDPTPERTVPPATTAELRNDVVAHPRDTRLVPVVVSDSSATPVGHDRPGTLWGAALATLRPWCPLGGRAVGSIAALVRLVANGGLRRRVAH